MDPGALDFFFIHLLFLVRSLGSRGLAWKGRGRGRGVVEVVIGGGLIMFHALTTLDDAVGCPSISFSLYA